MIWDVRVVMVPRRAVLCVRAEVRRVLRVLIVDSKSLVSALSRVRSALCVADEELRVVIADEVRDCDSVFLVNTISRYRGMGNGGRTFQFGNIDSELIPLFENAFSTFGDEVVEAVCEACHAVSQVVETEVYAWECVGH